MASQTELEELVVRGKPADTNSPGVYCIFNSASCKVYVGSSSQSIAGRWSDHRSDLRLGKHPNSYLQRAWDKHGIEAFKFVVLEQCEPGECVEREQVWIDKLGSAIRDYGYNISPKAGSQLGMRHSSESRVKIAEANRNRSQESRKKQADALRGRKRSEEAKRRTSESLRRSWESGAMHGYSHSQATRSKISQGLKGRKLQENHRNKIVKALTGRPVSVETRAKIGAANALALLGKSASVEARAKMSLASAGKPKPWCHKVKFEKALEIRRLYQEDRKVNSYRVLAKRFGVGRGVIRCVVLGKYPKVNPWVFDGN